jgi:hypothetical protein
MSDNLRQRYLGAIDNQSEYRSASSTRESGAVRRASMDLTRALADLRRGQ